MVNCCEAVAQKRLLAWVLVICCEEETRGKLVAGSRLK
jgi:hypothetical protein